MRKVLMALAGGALALTLGVPPVGASTVPTQPVAVRTNDDACGPNGYYAGDNGPYPAYEYCDGSDRFYDGNGCCYNG
jgi:hypothetical protein